MNSVFSDISKSREPRIKEVVVLAVEYKVVQGSNSSDSGVEDDWLCSTQVM